MQSIGSTEVGFSTEPDTDYSVFYLDMAVLRDNDFITTEGAEMVRTQLRNLCYQLRPEAVSVVDAFNLPDWVVDAPVIPEQNSKPDILFL